ncbi:MAG TPA: amino acid ABC transporter substrate-binding protein [Bacillota bacterium]|nr:amino acid ABC transporter substrate-binding protein [Bacillota bacterium]HPE38350.1 amino acid ABC transporter substrate-binding protein [Bacillota bacterium]
MKKILAMVMCSVMLLVSMAGCAKKDEKKQFVVGFDQEFPPMGFVDENGDYVGFDLDLAKEVAKRLDMEFVAQPISWDGKDKELSSKNIDCIWNGFTINGREDAYTWTTPYMSNNQVVIVNPDSGITSLADLAGKTICVQKESSGLNALTENVELSASIGNLVTVDTYLNAMMELESQAVDAIVMDEIVAYYELDAASADFIILEETLASEEYGVGFLLGNEELRDQVQKALEDMKADGTLAEISIKWFGEDITTI